MRIKSLLSLFLMENTRMDFMKKKVSELISLLPRCFFYYYFSVFSIAHEKCPHTRGLNLLIKNFFYELPPEIKMSLKNDMEDKLYFKYSTYFKLSSYIMLSNAENRTGKSILTFF